MAHKPQDSTKHRTITDRLRDKGIADAAERAGWRSDGRGGLKFPTEPGKRWRVMTRNGLRKWQPGAEPVAVLYAPPRTDWQSEMWLVEGETDCLAMHSAGIRNCVAVYGATFKIPEAVAGMKRRGVRRIIMPADNDKAGTNCAARARDACIDHAIDFEARCLGGLVGRKGDVGDLWQADGFDAALFIAQLVGLPPLALPPRKEKPRPPQGGYQDDADLAERLATRAIALGGKRKHNGWIDNLHCPDPHHDDKHPSFGIIAVKGVGKCHACGFAPSPRELARLWDIELPELELERRVTAKRNKETALAQACAAVDRIFGKLAAEEPRGVHRHLLQLLMRGSRGTVERNIAAAAWIAGQGGVEFGIQEICAVLDKRGAKGSESAIKHGLSECPVVERVGHGRYRLVESDVMTKRLKADAERAILKAVYGRRMTLEAYGDSDDVTEQLYAGIEDGGHHLTRAAAQKVTKRVRAEMDSLMEADGVYDIEAWWTEGDFDAWWYARLVENGEIATQGDLYKRTGFAPRQQLSVRKRSGFVSMRREIIVQADNPHDAREQSKERCAAIPMTDGRFKLQLPSQHLVPGSGAELDETAALTAEQYDKQAKCKKRRPKTQEEIDDAFCTLPPPKLPVVAHTDGIESKAFITRALWYTLIDDGVIKAADWRGREVTLEALEAALRGDAFCTLPENKIVQPPADGIVILDVGGIEIPF